MAIGDRMVMIDFQDARMGPAQYDLASLLKDSYYQLEDAQIDRLIDYYIARYEALSGARLDRPHFKRMFDLMAVQRNFKAIGSFASFLVKRGELRDLFSDFDVLIYRESNDGKQALAQLLARKRN
jgi:aminoglycoside/choline kinase family phosphotransferase